VSIAAKLLIFLLVVAASMAYGDHIGTGVQKGRDAAIIAGLNKTISEMQIAADKAAAAHADAIAKAEHDAQADYSQHALLYEKAIADETAQSQTLSAQLRAGTVRLRVALSALGDARSQQGGNARAATGGAEPNTTGTLAGAAADATHDYCDTEFNALRDKLILANQVIADDHAACDGK